jgi:NhaP-type Na+/H+ or K+/H+ antiporter
MFELFYLVAGALLVGMALVGSRLQRLPVTTAMLYLGVGILLGPAVFGLIRLDPLRDAAVLERVTEAVVVISLFTAGLKLRVPFRDRRWWLPGMLASVSMALTVGGVALAGVVGLGLSWGAAVLLGAILAPTDPVLASEVQTEHPGDDDRLRFGLTGEAGLNDGSAFPFVMLGLGLLGAHELGEAGWRWFAIDVVWAAAGGLAWGVLLGTATAQVVLYLRRTHQEAVGRDEFLALGLIGLTYGGAILLHTYGFLAVFAAALALRRVERQASDDAGHGAVDDAPVGELHEAATHGERAPAYMAHAVLSFNEQLERIGEVLVVVLVGAMLTREFATLDAVWFVPLLLLAIRPVAVLLGLVGTDTGRIQKGLVAWFGIRGIGSIYYLTYALEHGLHGEDAQILTALVLTTVAVSVVVHGASVRPLMARYHERKEARAAPAARPLSVRR